MPRVHQVSRRQDPRTHRSKCLDRPVCLATPGPAQVEVWHRRPRPLAGSSRRHLPIRLRDPRTSSNPRATPPAHDNLSATTTRVFPCRAEPRKPLAEASRPASWALTRSSASTKTSPRRSLACKPRAGVLLVSRQTEHLAASTSQPKASDDLDRPHCTEIQALRTRAGRARWRPGNATGEREQFVAF